MNTREALFVAVTAVAGCTDGTVIDKVNTGLKGGEDTAHELQHTSEEIDAIYRACNIRVNKADDVKKECLKRYGLVEK